MNISHKLMASAIEAAVPLIGGAVLTYRARRSSESPSKLQRWIGPLLLLFAAVTFLRPLLGNESQSVTYQTTKAVVSSRDVASLAYDDFLGTWGAVVEAESIRRRLIYSFTFKEDGDCTLEYTSFNVDNSAEVKHHYDMRCEVYAGKLSHAAKDPGRGEEYQETHTIESFDGDSFEWSDQFVGPIRYTRKG